MRRRVEELVVSRKLIDKDITNRELLNNTLVKASRYEGVISPEGVSACSYRALIAPKKYAGAKDTRFSDNVSFKGLLSYADGLIRPDVKRNCDKQIILLRGPFYPFVLGFDRAMKICYILFYDLLMMDFDVIDGIEKANSVEVIERYMNSQRLLPYNKKSLPADACLKVYETDNGVHYFIVSHSMPYTDIRSSSIMINTCSDFNYAAFSHVYGYSVRLNAKSLNKDRTPKTAEEIRKQFVQREGVNDGKGLVTYIGDMSNIDPYLDDLTNLCLNTQRFIRNSNLAENLANETDLEETLEQIRSFVRGEYKRVREGTVTDENYKWSLGIRTCEY